MSTTTSQLLRPLSTSHDMLLETRKRNGTWVATPVNPLVEGDHVLFRTWATSGKARRLRNFSEVRLAPSTKRGRPTDAPLRGRATQLTGAAADHAAHLINRRYPLLQGIGVRLMHKLRHLETQHYVVEDITPA